MRGLLLLLRYQIIKSRLTDLAGYYRLGDKPSQLVISGYLRFGDHCFTTYQISQCQLSELVFSGNLKLNDYCLTIQQAMVNRVS